MRKKYLPLIALIVVSCEKTNIPIDSSESVSSQINQKTPLGVYVLDRSHNGIDFDWATIEFNDGAKCVFKWSVDSRPFISHQTYVIEYNQNILFDFIWDTVSFAPSLEKGDSEAPSSLVNNDYRFFRKGNYSSLYFQSAGPVIAFDEDGEAYEVGYEFYAFELQK